MVDDQALENMNRKYGIEVVLHMTSLQDPVEDNKNHQLDPSQSYLIISCGTLIDLKLSSWYAISRHEAIEYGRVRTIANSLRTMIDIKGRNSQAQHLCLYAVKAELA